MPDPKDNEKQAGDGRSQQPSQRSPAATGVDEELESTPGVGENQAGLLKERTPTVDGRNRDYN